MARDLPVGEQRRKEPVFRLNDDLSTNPAYTFSEAAHTAFKASIVLDDESAYPQIRDDLHINGLSERLKDIDKSLKNEAEQQIAGAVRGYLSQPNHTDQSIQDGLDAGREMLHRANPNRVDEAYAETVASSASELTEDPRRRRYLRESLGTLAKDLATVQTSQEEIERIRNEAIASFDPSLASAAADFAGLLLPFAENDAIARVLTKVNEDIRFMDDERGALAWVGDRVLTGELINKWQDHFATLRPEEQAEAVRLVVDNIMEEGGVFLEHNDMMKLGAIQMLTQAPEGFNLDRTIGNLVGVLDAVGVGVLARRGLRTVRGVNAIDVANSGNPEAAAALVREALDDVSGETAKALGTSPEELLRMVGPKGVNDVLKTGPEHLQVSTTRVDEIVRDASQGGVVVTQRGRDKVLDKIRERMDAVQKSVVHASKTVIEPLSNIGVGYKAVFGRNATHGYTDAFEAMEEVGTLSTAMNTGVENIKILRSDVSTGRLVELQGSGARLEEGVGSVRGTPSKQVTLKTTDGAVMGRMDLLDEGNDLVLDIIDVAADFQKQGIGTGLHLHAINIARRSGKTLASSKLMSPGSVGVFRKLEELGFTIEKNPNVKTINPPGNEGTLVSTDGRPVFRVVGDVPGNMTAMRELVGDDLTKAVVNAEAGEYFIQVSGSHRYSGFDALWSGSQTTVLSGINAIFGRWTGDINSIFNKSAAMRAFASEDISQGVRQRLNRLLEEPFKGMKTAEKRAVMEIMLEGSKEGKVYSYGELVSKFGVDGRVSDKVVAGYRAIIQVNNALHRIADNKMRILLENKGMRTLHIGDYRAFARPIDDVDGAFDEVLEGDDGLRHVYDPETDTIVRLSESELVDLYDKGGKIGRLNSEEMVGNQATDFVLARGRSTGEFTGLPDNVLRYEPGYFTRIYKDGYFVDRVQTVTKNGKAGKTHTNTLHSAGSLTEAKRMAAKLVREAEEAGEQGVEFRFRRGRELQTTARDEADMAVKDFEGRLIYSRRGDRLTTELGESAIEDPITATQRAIGSLSQRAVRGDWLTGMRKEFVQEFADELKAAGIINPGAMSLPQLNKAVQSADIASIPARRLKEMKAQIGYINQMDNVSTPHAELWRGWMVGMAEWLEGVPLGRHLQPVAMAARNTTPIDVARTAAFTMFLVGNPIRQAFLQSQQILFLSGLNPKYIFGGGMSKDLVGLRYGLAKIDTADWSVTRQRMAKALGQTEDEYEQMVREFRSSGISSNIDSHQFVAGNFEEMFGVGPSRMNAFGTKAVETVKYPLRFAKRVGFDFGEINNLSMTWLVARRRFKDKTGRLPRTADEMNSVGAEARQLALGMNRSGELQYQRGLASLSTQFLSIQHKAFFAMLPAAMGGNRSITAAEKARIAMGQAVIFGSAGFGVQEIYDSLRRHHFDGEEIPKKADDILRGGFMDYGVNKILESVWGDDTDLSISSNWAAGSGPIVQTAEMLDKLVTLNWEELAFGASFSAGERINNTIGLAKAAWQQPDLDTEDRVLETLAVLPEVFSGYSNYAKTKAHLAMTEATANMPGVHLTVQEALAKRWLGIGTNKEQDYWNLLLDVKEIEAAIKDDARKAHDSAYELAKRFDVDENYDARLFARKMSQMLRLGNTGLDQMEVATRVNEFHRLARQQRRPGEESLYQLIGKILSYGGIDDMDRVRALISQGAFDVEFKNKMNDMLDDAQTTFEVIGFDPEALETR